MENNWLNIEKKTVIVTGGASGIGYACVEELLADGANVACVDMNPKAAEFAGATADNYLYVQCDITCKKAVDDMIAAVVAKFGTVDVLVNNAGINIPRLLVDEGNQFELDAAKVMVAKQSGVIINMSSECGLEGSEGQSVYAATKNAVNSLTRSWAKELGKKGIRVVGVAPGIMEATGLRTLSYETALAYTRGITVDQLRAGYSKTSTIPLNRSGKLSEVATTVAFLASEKAGYIHGVTINVAGGKTRG